MSTIPWARKCHNPLSWKKVLTPSSFYEQAHHADIVDFEVDGSKQDVFAEVLAEAERLFEGQRNWVGKNFFLFFFELSFKKKKVFLGVDNDMVVDR